MDSCELSTLLQQLNDGNSGESDFEIVCDSDSDAEITNYKKFDNFQDDSDFSLAQSNFHELSVDSEKLNSLVNKSKVEKINLSLSQEKILLPGQKITENLSTKLYSGEFLPKFCIKPLDSPENCVGDNDSKVQNSNLPEIVLTSYEKENTGKINHTMVRSDLKIIGHGNREENSSSPELYLQRNLNAAAISMKTTSNSRRRITDETVNSYSLAAKPLNLEKPLPYRMSINVNHPSHSASNLISQTGGFDHYVLLNSKAQVPNELKCKICEQLFKDPRTLNCLHSFCFQCLVNENFGKDESIPFWSRPDGNNFEWKGNLNTSTKSSSHGSGDSDYHIRPDSRSSMSSIKSKKSSDRKSKDKSHKSISKPSSTGQPTEKVRLLFCSVCQYCTEIPIGGMRQLPQNLILVRKVESLLLNQGTDILTNAWCNLCCAEVSATYHCVTCFINLCGFCKDSHERQKTTAGHNVKNILDLQRTRKSAKKNFEESKLNLKCALHPGYDLKSFCNTCQQIICSDCTILLHKGHKIDPTPKAFKEYQKLIKDSSERSKPICEYVEHSILKLGGISKKINKKCDEVQNDVETFMAAYFEAVEVHRKTLIQQITRARETKIQMILEQQLEMERKSKQTKEAIIFTEELFEMGSEVEILSFVNMLLKRFEYCQKLKPPLDAKISDTLHFLPEVRAPSTKAQNNIPLYGIITTQTVEPQFCTLETEGYTQLRVHRKVELTILSRDADGAPLCHGGLDLNVQIKYKDNASKLIERQVSDRRDGTYVVSFIPDNAGTLFMSITINNRHIKGSPFTLAARNVRPHTGIFHCCTFCSSKGSKITTCACEGIMPGFKGCGHGHNGHPGRRHWSCCGNILENSECSTANNNIL